MSARPLSLASIADAVFEVVPELPDYTVILPGTSELTLSPIAGEEGEAGSVSAVKWEVGGLQFINMPMATSAYLAAGSLVVTNDDGSTFEVNTGEGLYTEPGWSGKFTATSPITMFLHV
ncbi:MAG TPA: hypothetical protein VNT53_03575 [Pseudolysinimonas sp.]|nr:hypothetical protein [Pseudolysinimonas sp.]